MFQGLGDNLRNSDGLEQRSVFESFSRSEMQKAKSRCYRIELVSLIQVADFPILVELKSKCMELSQK